MLPTARRDIPEPSTDGIPDSRGARLHAGPPYRSLRQRRRQRCHHRGRLPLQEDVGHVLREECGLRIDLDDRDWLHADHSKHVGERIPELNLGWQPNLVLIDGRRSTVNWDGRGDYVYPNTIMASGDMVAIDAEAVRILKQYPANNRLDIPINEIEQLRGAENVGLGSIQSDVVAVAASTRTEQKGINE